MEEKGKKVNLLVYLINMKNILLWKWSEYVVTHLSLSRKDKEDK